ncbi:MFS transporter [Streptomyces sp. ASQP_92]|uniref:MFS transporter n=1 Tax=Streptomyces sp. ASQP_92 TaxID=2979116 RepID=UPI0021C082E0|nr:MFS transporter [Streptomyces sp. ASQP_92]MCT9088933.1 MFS transporter [Streptomyces sp. ASQP_92]
MSTAESARRSAGSAPTSEPNPSPSSVPLRRWLALVAVAVGTFAMVTAEQLPMGLLTPIGGSLDVSEGTAGLLVTVPGLVASATAPLLPVLIRRADRRTVLIALLGLMAAANVLSVLTSDFGELLVSRFLIGISIGGFWALAAGIAVSMVPTAHVGRATALVFGGATAANVLGVPAGTLIGEFSSWRTAFAAVGGLGLLVVVALFLLLPSLPARAPVRLSTLAAQFRNPAVRTGVLTTFLLVGGHFAAFTFVSPALREISGISQSMVGPLLLVFGVAGILGNFLAGAVVGRDVRRVVMMIGCSLALILALFPLVGTSPAGGIVLLIGWGLAFGGVPVSVQTWILQSAPREAEAATALNTSVFNLAVALGALFGGLAVDAAGLDVALWGAAVVGLLTTITVWRTRGTAA